MWLVLLLALILLLVFGFATTVHWLLWIALVLAILWVIGYFVGRGESAGWRRW